jgi:hypothetical protein
VNAVPDIKMLQNTQGADNGFEVKKYIKDETYTVGDKLARTFVNTMKVAELVPMKEERMARGPIENKDASNEKKEDKDAKEKKETEDKKESERRSRRS